jgi:exosome complex component CSL4
MVEVSFILDHFCWINSTLMEEKCVIPGTYLGSTLHYKAGKGTYVKDNAVYAVVIGRLQVLEETIGKPLIQILQEKEPSPVPQVGHIVIARIIRVNPRYATLHILVANNRPCQEPYKGIIK